METTLSKITRENYEEVCDLEVTEEQQEYVAENMWSLVEAQFNPGYETRAICIDGQPVGFLMWVPEDEGKQAIWRFMVDRRYQNRGVGRRALEIALDEIKSTNSTQAILIGYNVKNDVARKFYASFGFVEKGLDKDCDDMIAELIL